MGFPTLRHGYNLEKLSQVQATKEIHGRAAQGWQISAHTWMCGGWLQVGKEHKLEGASTPASWVNSDLT